MAIHEKLSSLISVLDYESLRINAMHELANLGSTSIEACTKLLQIFGEGKIEEKIVALKTLCALKVDRKILMGCAETCFDFRNNELNCLATQILITSNLISLEVLEKIESSLKTETIDSDDARLLATAASANNKLTPPSIEILDECLSRTSSEAHKSFALPWIKRLGASAISCSENIWEIAWDRRHRYPYTLKSSATMALVAIHKDDLTPIVNYLERSSENLSFLQRLMEALQTEDILPLELNLEPIYDYLLNMLCETSLKESGELISFLARDSQAIVKKVKSSSYSGVVFLKLLLICDGYTIEELENLLNDTNSCLNNESIELILEYLESKSEIPESLISTLCTLVYKCKKSIRVKALRVLSKQPDEHLPSAKQLLQILCDRT